jgi:hypothetical protein
MKRRELNFAKPFENVLPVKLTPDLYPSPSRSHKVKFAFLRSLQEFRSHAVPDRRTLRHRVEQAVAGAINRNREMTIK